MKTLIFAIILISTMNTNAQDKPTLIYVGDPMCSWCYGFSHEIEDAITELGEEIQLEVVMGGLRPYNTQTMADLKDFLSDHWKHVYEASGQPFQYGILDTKLLYDTEPACRAVMIARELQASTVMTYFHNVQTAFYAENKNPHLTGTYADIAESMGIDRITFVNKFESKEYKASIKNDFLRASQLGVRSFPTVLLSVNGETKVVSAGYSKAEKVVEVVKSLMN
ncbi:MAG: DsbA family protein [Saprospiraceae bacterium]